MTHEAFIKYRKTLFDRLIAIGMVNKTSDISCEKYWCGFVTVSLSIYRDNNALYVEKYYDNELLSGYDCNFTFTLDQLDAAIAKCESLIKVAASQEPILNFGE